MQESKSKISCPTFQNQEVVIKDITERINKTKDVRGKARFALELQREVSVLLSCPDYNDKNLDCKNCHFIADVRKKTADLIIKAQKLA